MQPERGGGGGGGEKVEGKKVEVCREKKPHLLNVVMLSVGWYSDTVRGSFSVNVVRVFFVRCRAHPESSDTSP